MNSYLFLSKSDSNRLISLPWLADALMINLLEAKNENHFARNSDALGDIVRAMSDTQPYVIIDEIQKLPKLLDIVHDLIETIDKNSNKLALLPYCLIALLPYMIGADNR